jgi:transposase InsO family protein
VTDAFPWDEAARHLIRDRDGAFGPAYTHRIRAMGIRDHPTAPHSPWQNGHVERLIGSIRRESLDHLVVFDEAAVASRSEELRFLLQPDTDASLIGQERAGFSAPAEARPHRSHPNSGWAASPICQGLGFD